MARFKQDVVLNKPDDFVYFIMNDYLQKQGFVMSDWKGEPAYRTGDGFVEAHRYLKWSYANGNFHLEAWIKGGLGREMDLEGFVATLVKKPYKESLLQLISVLQQPLPENAQNVPNQSGGAGAEGQTASAQAQNGPAPNVVPVQTVDHHGAAQAGLIFGILSIIGGLFIPLVGVILGCIGFSRARMGAGSSKASQAKAGKICSIVGLALSAGIWILNIVLSSFNLMLYM